MSNRVIRNTLFDHRLLAASSKKKRAIKPIGLDRFNSVRSTKLDLFKPRSALSTKNLIKYLLGNGVRAQRATLPKKKIRMRVLSPNGNCAVRIKYN